jgi:hypothetical protein
MQTLYYQEVTKADSILKSNIILVSSQRRHLTEWGQTGANASAKVPKCLHYYVSER